MPLSTRAYLKKLNKEVNRLQDAVHPVEYKWYVDNISHHFDDGKFEYPSNGGYAPTELTAYIHEGEDETERVGDVIKLQNLTVRGAVYFTREQNSNSSGSRTMSSVCRIFVVTAKSFDSASTTLTMGATGAALVPMFYTTGGGADVGPFAPKSDESLYSTNILFDKVIAVGGINGGLPQTVPFEFNIPLNLITTYDNTTSTAKTHPLWIGTVSDSVAINATSLQTDCPFVDMRWRLSYTDS